MRLTSLGTKAALLATATVLAAAAVALPAVAQDSEPSGDDSSSAERILKIGWAQDPQTLNPFFGLDEEDFNIWSINWDLLVNFSPEDFSPSPGIAESWEVSDDKKSVTFTLAPDLRWSDGEPITSEDVKWSLETLGEEGVLFSGYTSNVTSIETPDEQTVVINTKRPDARIVGGLFVYILPEHIWGKESVEDLTSTYKPPIPLVGSGPFVATEFERGRIITMERNPEFRGETPELDEIQFIKFGNLDAVERALKLGEIDLITEVTPGSFENLNADPNVETVQSASPSYTQLAFNLCPEDLCPDAEFNPAVQDVEVRQAVAYAVDRERINAIAARDTSFVAHGILPSFYKSFYEVPEQDYPYDPEMARQILDDAGWVEGDDGVRTKDGETLSFDLEVRSESAYNIQAGKLVAEMAAEVGIEFNVQVVSVDKLTEDTVRKVDGKPAPTFDTFIWGWGGDAYDPSFLLGLLTTDEIGGSSDGFYSNPEYDRLYEEQAGEFDVEARKEIVQEMVAIAQEDVAYLVLTDDPNLQAYRTDRIADPQLACPADDTGDLLCEQAGYEPLLTLSLGESSASDDDGGGGTVLIVIVGALVLGGIAYFVTRMRRDGGGTGRGGRGEPLEFEEE
jgi:peptide/nickel transport system substrate-binding protein